MARRVFSAREIEADRDPVLPTIVRVESRAGAVGDRIAKGHDSARRSRREHIDRLEPVHRCGRRGKRSPRFIRTRIARAVCRPIGSDHRSAVLAGVDVRLRDIEADGEVLPGKNGDRDRVADDAAARRDHDRRRAGEGDLAARPCGDECALHSISDISLADGYGRRAESVVEPDPNGVARYRHARDHANGRIADRRLGHIGLLRRSPRRNPVRAMPQFGLGDRRRAQEQRNELDGNHRKNVGPASTYHKDSPGLRGSRRALHQPAIARGLKSERRHKDQGCLRHGIVRARQEHAAADNSLNKAARAQRTLRMAAQAGVTTRHCAACRAQWAPGRWPGAH